LIDAVNGNPIANATVEVREGFNNYDGGVEVSTLTNATGDFRVELEQGYYTFTFAKEGYVRAHRNVSVSDNLTMEFTMAPMLQEEGALRIVLTWGATPSDLDSHFVKLYCNSDNSSDCQVAYHVAYYNMHPTDEAFLDRDDTTSYGPETITVYYVDSNATYRYYVHNYSYSYDTNSTSLSASQAMVTVYWGDHEWEFPVPQGQGNAWKVFEIVNGTLIPCTDNCLFGVHGSHDSLLGLYKLLPNDWDSIWFIDLPKKQ
jgi:hypothetical protein